MKKSLDHLLSLPPHQQLDRLLELTVSSEIFFWSDPVIDTLGKRIMEDFQKNNGQKTFALIQCQIDWLDQVQKNPTHNNPNREPHAALVKKSQKALKDFSLCCQTFDQFLKMENMMRGPIWGEKISQWDQAGQHVVALSVALRGKNAPLARSTLDFLAQNPRTLTHDCGHFFDKLNDLSRENHDLVSFSLKPLLINQFSDQSNPARYTQNDFFRESFLSFMAEWNTRHKNEVDDLLMDPQSVSFVLNLRRALICCFEFDPDEKSPFARSTVGNEASLRDLIQKTSAILDKKLMLDQLQGSGHQSTTLQKQKKL